MPNSFRPLCFVDTNVWLYAFIESGAPEKSGTARRLIQTSDPTVSTQVINEVCVNLLRRANFSEEQIAQLIEAFYEKCQVVELTKTVLLMASRLRQRYPMSFWDSLIVAAALEAGVPVLYSEDMQHGLIVEGQLQIQNPFVSK